MVDGLSCRTRNIAPVPFLSFLKAYKAIYVSSEFHDPHALDTCLNHVVYFKNTHIQFIILLEGMQLMVFDISWFFKGKLVIHTVNSRKLFIHVQ